MKFEFHVFFHVGHTLQRQLDLILERQDLIMGDTQATLAKLAAVNASLDSIAADIIGLKDLIAAGGTPDEVAAAVDALAAKASAIDAQTP